ncbi:hypothetical protein [Moraxella marmotae]|uniref:hypothetical protein n=1 Tax=Moraxella marmotae TaxID=3344520 RepID=UPI0035F2FDEB
MENKKIIGQVDWFGTTAGGDYGFIKYTDEHKKENSVFFHKNHIIQSNTDIVRQLRLGKQPVVSFFIKPSKRNPGKFEASKVTMLDDENDKEYILQQWSCLIVSKNNSYIQLQLYNTIKTNINEYLKLTPLLDETLFKISQNIIEPNLLDIFLDYINNNPILSQKIIDNLLQRAEEDIQLLLKKFTTLKSFLVHTCKGQGLNKFTQGIYERLISKSINLTTLPSDAIIVLLEIFIDSQLNETDDIIGYLLSSNSTETDVKILVQLHHKLTTLQIEHILTRLTNTKASIKFINDTILEQILHLMTSHQLSPEIKSAFLKSYIDNIDLEDIDKSQILKIVKIFSTYGFQAEKLNLVSLLKPIQLISVLENYPSLQILNDADTVQLMFNIICTAEVVPFYFLDKISVLKFLQVINRLDLNYNYQEKFLNLLDNFVKLELWLDDQFTGFDFNTYSELAFRLSSDRQQLYIKKIFALLAGNHITLQLDDILNINVSDYSTKVVFKLLENLAHNHKKGKFTLRNDILKEIEKANLIECADNILELKGYFGLCPGRVSERYYLVENTQPFDNQITLLGYGKVIDGKQYYYVRECKEKLGIRKQNAKIRNDKWLVDKTTGNYNLTDGEIENQDVKICDGRWSINKKTGNYNLTDGEMRFAWCKNKKCIQPAYFLQNLENWRNYTLLDFLNILQIPYYQNDIEIFYATINHVNIFLKHLNCEGCGRLLKPKDPSNYSFYRVNTFFCDNFLCSNPDKDVYISHCANGKCDGIIDSRYSTRCENNWVICEQCFACCDGEKLKNRNFAQKTNGQPETTWSQPKGHRGMNILCPTCANPMHFKDIHQKKQEYLNTIADFESLVLLNIDNKLKLVTKTGINSKGKKWFVVNQRHLSRKAFESHLNNWLDLGFNIPGYPSEQRDSYLVSEPLNLESAQKTITFSCPNCKSIFKRGNAQYEAVQYWHSSDINPI